MSTSKPEFSRPVSLDQIVRPGGERIAARAEECAALAERFGLVSLDWLDAEYWLVQEAAGILATGRLTADLSQTCVVTGEPVAEHVEAPFNIRFLPDTIENDAEDLELSADDYDIVFFPGRTIDIGEAVAETLSLVMSPYPRAPDADAYMQKIGVEKEEDMSPFAALKATFKKD